MTLHEFRLVLQVPADVADDPYGESVDDLSDRLYESGCDDGSLGMHCGVWEITLHREAHNITEAIHSAIEQVERVGCKVERVESLDQRLFDQINEELMSRTTA